MGHANFRCRSLGDSNPCPRHERVVSRGTRRRERSSTGMDWPDRLQLYLPSGTAQYRICRGRNHHLLVVNAAERLGPRRRRLREEPGSPDSEANRGSVFVVAARPAAINFRRPALEPDAASTARISSRPHRASIIGDYVGYTAIEPQHAQRNATKFMPQNEPDDTAAPPPLNATVPWPASAW